MRESGSGIRDEGFDHQLPDAPPPPELPPPPEKPSLDDDDDHPLPELPELSVIMLIQLPPGPFSSVAFFLYQSVRPRASFTIGKPMRYVKNSTLPGPTPMKAMGKSPQNGMRKK